jgi:hypothetical protein
MTEYVILLQDEKGLWEDIGRTTAAGSRAAITQALKSPTGAPPKNGGTFQAIPARSWQPVKVAVEQALKFS